LDGSDFPWRSAWRLLTSGFGARLGSLAVARRVCIAIHSISSGVMMSCEPDGTHLDVSVRAVGLLMFAGVVCLPGGARDPPPLVVLIASHPVEARRPAEIAVTGRCLWTALGVFGEWRVCCCLARHTDVLSVHWHPEIVQGKSSLNASAKKSNRLPFEVVGACV
jgi:hypothetical protein